MSRVLPILLAALSGAPALAAEAADDWWNPACAFRKRVQVRLPAMELLGFACRPPQERGEDVVPAQAVIHCEGKVQAGALREVRVVDAGGNVLPAVVTGPDTRGLVHVTFPARRMIAGRLAGAIGEQTGSVALDVGRAQAVTPGLRFHVLAGFDAIATLEVTAVEARASTARVLERSVPQIAQGTPVRSETLTAAEYWIYYGNPQAGEAGPVWTPPASPVRQYTWQITEGGPPTTVEALRATMRSGVAYVGSGSLSSMSSRSNPHISGEAHYIVAYVSWVHCEIGGLYRFSLDTYGPSFLLVDGRLAAQRQGFFMQTGQFEHRGKIQLDRGHHLLTFFAGEGRRQVSRLGWQPVTAKVYHEVPASFFTTRVEAEPVAFEARDQRQQAFFTYSLAPRAVLAGGRRYQFVQFHNRSGVQPANDVEPVAYVWSFGEGEQSRETSPGLLVPMLEGETATSLPVTLQAVVGGKAAGEYQRTVHCEARPAEKLRVAIDIVSFANIVYDDERTSIAVRVRNANLSPVPLQAVGRLLPEGGGKSQVILLRRVLLGAENEDFCILPVDMKKLHPKRASIELNFYLGGQRVLGTSARVIPSPEELTGLRRGLGALYDREDRRVMICAEIEDEDRHLRWPVPRYIRDDVLPKARGTRRNVLLFGDRMTNELGPGKAFTDYVALLGSRLPRDERTLQFVPRSTGLLPTLADLIHFTKTLESLETPPDIVIFSPGLADVAQATGDRDFVRSIDVLIDLLRAQKHRIKPVIVSPPPYPGNPRVSKHYTEALARLAQRHRIPFLNLHDLLAEDERKDWVRTYYAAPEAEGIFLRNPNEQAHRRIAEALYELIY